MRSEIKQFKVEIKVAFEMTDLGTLSYFLGLKFVQTLHKYCCIKKSMHMKS